MSEHKAKIAFALQILGGICVIGAVVVAGGKGFEMPSYVLGAGGLISFAVGWVINQTCEPID